MKMRSKRLNKGQRTQQNMQTDTNDNGNGVKDIASGRSDRKTETGGNGRQQEEFNGRMDATGGGEEGASGHNQDSFKEFQDSTPQWATWNLKKLAGQLDNPVQHSDLFSYWERTYEMPLLPPTNESEFEKEAEPIRNAMRKKGNWDGFALVEFLNLVFKQNHVLRSTQEFLNVRASAMNIAQANPMEIYATEQVFVEDRLMVDEDTIIWMAAQEVLGAPWSIYNVDTNMREDINEATKVCEERLATRARAKARRESMAVSKKADSILMKRPRNPLEDTSTKPDDDPAKGKDNSMDVDGDRDVNELVPAVSPGSSMAQDSRDASMSESSKDKTLSFSEMTKKPEPSGRVKSS